MLFTIIVQNAVEYRVMGAASASLTFFRATGGTLGTAIFGSFLAAAVNGVQNVFLAGAGVMALAAVFCTFLRELPLRRTVGSETTRLPSP